ncbi:helix-turn-helix domain-containing protein [Streptomyces sp. NPDC052101]|uniref:helix-turn-helix domain-containing protein n=1 Tax=Streptomyces sp. NPDC052101 TaxID=3155763 RepID=UPI003432DBA2
MVAGWAGRVRATSRSAYRAVIGVPPRGGRARPPELSSQEACRVVGINYRTGKRWRNGRAPSKKTPARDAWTVRGERVVSGARYLTQDERLYIADRVREKVSLRTIAAELERSPSAATAARCGCSPGLAVEGDCSRPTSGLGRERRLRRPRGWP